MGGEASNKPNNDGKDPSWIIPNGDGMINSTETI